MTVKQINRHWLVMDAVVLAFWLGFYVANWSSAHPKQEAPVWLGVIGLLFLIASFGVVVDVIARAGRFLWAMQREGAEDWGSAK